MADDDVIDPRYEILRVVSEGSRATVLKALDTVHGSAVGLKVYPVVDEDRQALLAEAKVLMNVEPNRHLPRCRGDFFSSDGNHYVLVMSWIDGDDLQTVLDDEGTPGLPLDEVCGYIDQIAEALDHLHSHDPPIVHGDVKPGNIIRKTPEQVVLVDFDISGVYQTEARLGTPGFVAPEVAAGDKPTPSSDIYSLAATAVALLYGSAPTHGETENRSVAPDQRAQLTALLRQALSADPTKRPGTARKLARGLQKLSVNEPFTGMVALLAYEVAHAGRLWKADGDEMKSALGRLRDIRDQIAHDRGGRVMSSMNEGDRSVIGFRELSAAAHAALDLHDRVAAEVFPPGFQLELRAGLNVGEVTLVDGAYTGLAVDHVSRLRTLARPATTIASERTADYLADLAGRDMSVVPLGETVDPQFPSGLETFAITRPGAEQAALSPPPERKLHTWAPPAIVAEEPVTTKAATAEPATPSTVSRSAVLAEVIDEPVALGLLAITGVAAIFRFVLAEQLDLVVLASSVLLVSFAVSVVYIAWSYRHAYAMRHEALASVDRERQQVSSTQVLADERWNARRRLASDFEALSTDEGIRAAGVLTALGDEFDATVEWFTRHRDRAGGGLSTLVVAVEDTYRQGMSALSDALARLESASASKRSQLSEELAEIEARLERDQYVDDDERAHDRERCESRRRLVLRHVEALRDARQLIFAAERCTTSITEARVEVAASEAGDIQVSVDAAVGTLQHTIRRVRDVREHLRRMTN